MANTKLTDYQKAQLAGLAMDAENMGIQVLNLDDKSTIAYKLRGNTVEFAMSVMSPDEKKFRRKVGKYLALRKFFLGNTVCMAVFDFELMCETVWDAYPFE